MDSLPFTPSEVRNLDQLQAYESYESAAHGVKWSAPASDGIQRSSIGSGNGKSPGIGERVRILRIIHHRDIHNGVFLSVIPMKVTKPESVSAAVAQIPAVQPELLSQLFAGHYRRVLLAAYRVVGNMADAEDVAQGVFLRLGEGEMPPMANAGSYLYRSAVNGALDLLRKRGRSPLEPLDCADAVASTRPDASPEAQASAGELARWLRQAMKELSPRTAEMFALRYLEEFSNGEIAKLMDTSQAVVAVTLYQARAKLKKRLNEFERGMR